MVFIIDQSGFWGTLEAHSGKR